MSFNQENISKTLRDSIVIPYFVMGFILVITILISFFFFYSPKFDSSNIEIRGAVEESKIYLAEELFMEQSQAINMRLENIVKKVLINHEGLTICLRVMAKASSGMKLYQKYCNKSLQNESYKPISDIFLGESLLGNISYAIKSKGLMSSPIVKFFSITFFIGFILSMITSFAVSKLLFRKVLYPMISKTIEIEHNSKVIDEINTISRQVAHDIRSPLAALDMILSDTTYIPENEREIIRNATHRIQDIADNLLVSSKAIEEDKNNLDIYMLSALIEPLIAEKRMQYKQNRNLNISMIQSRENYGIFVRVNAHEFKRSLSNLINNAVEASPRPTIIEVQSIIKDQRVIVSITDNGPGIPKEYLANIFDKGVSFGKTQGSGLGLYYAHEVVKKWEGKLSISTDESIGTTVLIDIPIVNPPVWFLRKLNIKKSSTIVILDDDLSIHQVWDSMLDQVIGLRDEVEVTHLSSVDEFNNWFNLRDKSIIYKYLFDFELHGSNVSGLDLIEEYNLSSNSVLVTSHYDEKNIRHRCKKKKIKLLPKNLVIHVSIGLSSNIDLVLIDDDQIIHSFWSLEAKKRNIKMNAFFSIEDFLLHQSEFSSDVLIYIDSNLGDNVKGEDESIHIYNAGFEKLYLATGYDPKDITKTDWIIAVHGKGFPTTL